jgi:hypothetical protein
MLLPKAVKEGLLKIAKEKKLFLEGNLLKIIEPGTDDPAFAEYLKICKERDISSRKKRLEVTKQVQSQNTALAHAMGEKETLMMNLQHALEQAEDAKKEAEILRDSAMEDLDHLQKRTQFELIGTIVKVALWVIVGVGVLTTVMYAVALLSKTDTQIIGSTWSNMFGILLTNAFSIVGTIMGVKYATDNKNEK